MSDLKTPWTIEPDGDEPDWRIEDAAGKTVGLFMAGDAPEAREGLAAELVRVVNAHAGLVAACDNFRRIAEEAYLAGGERREARLVLQEVMALREALALAEDPDAPR